MNRPRGARRTTETRQSPATVDACRLYVKRGVSVGRLQLIVMVCAGRLGVLVGDGGRGIGLEEVPDAAGEVALMSDDRLVDAAARAVARYRGV